MTNYRTLSDLQTNLSACRQCADAGYPIESTPIFSGQQTARLFLIGQAPGSVEGDTGRPFGGPSGRRLFGWLERAGWDEADFRERCYISAVTKCFPGKSPNGRGDRVPTAAERKLCRPWLDGELALVDPEVVVPVGRLAIDLFYEGKQPLTELIGTSTKIDGRTIVPLPHPSGASAWTNAPDNMALLDHSLGILKQLKIELDL